MPLTAGQRRVISTKSERLTDAVLKEFGPVHKDVVTHVFGTLRESMKAMEIFFIPGLGKFGPSRTRIQNACDRGFLKEEKSKVCENL